jgi:hypothetical protein
MTNNSYSSSGSTISSATATKLSSSAGSNTAPFVPDISYYYTVEPNTAPFVPDFPFQAPFAIPTSYIPEPQAQPYVVPFELPNFLILPKDKKELRQLLIKQLEQLEEPIQDLPERKPRHIVMSDDNDE